MVQCEKPLRTNVAWLVDFAALAIAMIKRNHKTIQLSATRNLAKNQIGAREIGNDKSGPVLSAIASRKGNDHDFASYRFDHAASSSAEVQSRPRTDSLSSAPLNGCSMSSSIGSLVPMAFYYAKLLLLASNQFIYVSCWPELKQT